MLESLFGYDAFHAGLVLSPAGIFTIVAIVIVGALLGRGVDARWLIGCGLLIVAAGNFWMSQLNLDIAPVAGHLAAGRDGRRSRPRLCAAECRRLHLHPAFVARCRGWSSGAIAQ